MANVALLLCFAYIVYLMRTERVDEEEKNSWAIWVPLLWFLLCACRSPGLWLRGMGPATVTTDSYTDSDPINTIIYVVLILVGMYILRRRMASVGSIIGAHSAVFLFMGLCLASFLWSDDPPLTIKHWIKGGLGNMIMVLIVMTEERPTAALKSLYFRVAYMMVPISLTLMKFFPDMGRVYDRSSGDVMYIGVTYGKNPMGALNFICGIAVFWDLLDRWGDPNESRMGLPFLARVVLMAIIWIIFGMIHSTTSMMCLIIAITVVLSLSLPFVRNNVDAITFYVVGGGLGFYVLDKTFGIVETIVLSLGKDMTLTGRDMIWKDVLAESFNRLVGAGYQAYWTGQRLLNLWDKHWWHPKQAHNGYLETYLTLGWVGVFFLFYLLISCYRNSASSMRVDFSNGRFRLAVFIAALAYNITEAAFHFLQPVWWTLLVFCSVLPLDQEEKEEPASRGTAE